MIRFLLIFLLISFANPCLAQNIPKKLENWIDSATGHKVVQLSDIPYSTLPYFTSNIFTYDENNLVYVSPKGIHVLNLTTFHSNLAVDGTGKELWFIGAGRRTNRIFYLVKVDKSPPMLEALNLEDGVAKKIASIPNGYRIESINADESLAVGVFDEGKKIRESNRGKALYARAATPSMSSLFTVDLGSGSIQHIYRSNEWLSHPQFSPTDSSLLMYSIEGPWHQVDRIWLIKKDGSERKLVHARTMSMEIAGHEFWSRDGHNVIYDWQFPKGKNFFIATYDVSNSVRTAIPITANQWSLHFNSSADPNLLIGDGSSKINTARADDGSYISIYRKGPLLDSKESTIWKTRDVRIERLVDMRGHDYRLEPNAHISPDNKWIVFRSNMFGSPMIFAVQTTKSNENIERRSTYEYSKIKREKYNKEMMIDQ